MALPPWCPPGVSASYCAKTEHRHERLHPCQRTRDRRAGKRAVDGVPQHRLDLVGRTVREPI